jgi:predicted dehydrogenase
MKNHKKLKGVLIGTGYFSRFQLDAWQRIADVDICAICDLSVDKAFKLQQEFHIPNVYQDYKHMILQESPDFVDILTPPATHFEIVAFAAQQNVHVICQKPLADSFTKAKALVDMVSQYGVRFMVHENWRWQPWYREMKKLIDSQTIGSPTSYQLNLRLGDGWGKDAYLARQPYFRSYPRLLMHETGVHFVDALRFLFGEVEFVFAQLRQLNPVILGEDSGQVILKMVSGVTAVFNLNRYNESEAAHPHFTYGTIRIDGSEGHLSLNAEGQLFVKKLGQPVQEHCYPLSKRGFAGDCVFALQQHFVEAMREKRPFESSATDFLKSVEVIEAIYQSAAKNQVVHLPVNI